MRSRPDSLSPPLYPSDPGDRRRALEISAFFTDGIGHEHAPGRLFGRGRKGAGVHGRFSLATDHGGRGRGVQQRAMLPIAWQYVVRRYGLRPGFLRAQ